MADFGRHFPIAWMDMLRARPQPAWWEDVVNCTFTDVSGQQQPLFLAIRNGYLNAYVEGQSVLKMKFDDLRSPTSLRARIHHKYLDANATGQVYKVFDGSLVNGERYIPKQSFRRWVQRARCYAQPKSAGDVRSEKQGVAVIAGRNGQVIDVEMALPGPVADRIDIVALERDGDSIYIVFYEVKLFSNPALRASNGKPKVLAQLDRYAKWLASDGREAQVTQAYRQACKLLVELRAMQGAEPAHGVVEAASLNESNLRIDKVPRLIVFGYDGLQTSDSWTKHEECLRRSGISGVRLILKPRPEDVKLPEARLFESRDQETDEILLSREH